MWLRAYSDPHASSLLELASYMDKNPRKMCPECATEIPVEAKKCPHCRSKISASTEKSKRVLVGIILISFCVSLMAIGAAGDSAPSVPAVQDPSEIIAFAVSQGFVESTLKAPSTAKFSSQRDVADLGEGRYRVRSYVDSQNGFGAMIRSDWETVLKYNQGDPYESSSWTFERVVIDGDVVYKS